MSQHRGSQIAAAALGLSLCFGCAEAERQGASDPPVPTATALSESADSSRAAGQVLSEATEKRFEGITLTIPAGWEERPVGSEFIQAEYRIDGKAGPARMTLSSAGGGVDANLERWQGQFRRGPDDPDPVRDTVAVDGVEATTIELTGTFTDGFSKDGPQANWCMLGAIIPTGPANFFLKLTGPRDTVTAHREEFRSLVTSARLAK